MCVFCYPWIPWISSQRNLNETALVMAGMAALSIRTYICTSTVYIHIYMRNPAISDNRITSSNIMVSRGGLQIPTFTVHGFLTMPLHWISISIAFSQVVITVMLKPFPIGFATTDVNSQTKRQPLSMNLHVASTIDNKNQT